MSLPSTSYPSACFILRLPSDLHLYILSFASYKDVIRFAQTCRLFREIVASSIELQYRIESGGHCLKLLRADNRPIYERYRLLREKIEAWESLNLDKPHSTNLVSYDDTSEYTPVISIADECLIIHTTDPYTVRVIDCSGESPSRSTFWSSESLASTTPASEVIAVHIDIYQDLLVYATVETGLVTRGRPPYHLSVRTLSGARDHDDVHPLATQRILISTGSEWDSEFFVRAGNSKLDIHGDFVAMLGSAVAVEEKHWLLLQVWNWKSGGGSMCTAEWIVADPVGELPVQGFFSLGSDIIIVFVTGRIEVFCYANLDEPLHHKACFLFPFSPSNPQKLRSSASSYSVHTQNPTSRDPSFVPSPDGAVFSVITDYPRNVVVVSTDIFLHPPPPPLSPLFPRLRQHKDFTTFPWEMWGHANSREFPPIKFCTPVCGVSGARLVMGSLPPDLWGWNLSILDFNPFRISRFLAQRKEDDQTNSGGHTHSRVVTGPGTDMFPGFALGEPDRLSYLETTLKEIRTDTLADIYMDSSGIILVQKYPHRSNEGYAQLQVDMFLV